MYTYTHNLVGGSTPLNNMKISWDDYSQYMEKIMFQTTNLIYIPYLYSIYIYIHIYISISIFRIYIHTSISNIP